LEKKKARASEVLAKFEEAMRRRRLVRSRGFYSGEIVMPS